MEEEEPMYSDFDRFHLITREINKHQNSKQNKEAEKRKYNIRHQHQPTSAFSMASRSEVRG
jgi:hypothetical protein